jgi:hypothetical protein
MTFPIGITKNALDARRVHEHGKQTGMILLAIEDIAGRKKRQVRYAKRRTGGHTSWKKSPTTL